MVLKWVKKIQEHSDYTFLKKQPHLKNNNINSCVKWVNAPSSVKELINTEDFSNYLLSKIIFFHKKSPSCNDLINKRLKIIKDASNIKYIEIHDIKCVNEFKEKIYQEHYFTTIYIVDIVNNKIIPDFFNSIKNIGIKKNCGLWIKGYIEFVLEYIPSFFDGVFIFDTSKYEFDLIKRKLSVSDKAIKFLRENQNDYLTESVLFYWNYERCSQAPSLYVNPIVLGVGRCLDYKKIYNTNTIERNYFNISGGLTLKKYINNGQVASMGDDSNVHHNQFNQTWNENQEKIDLNILNKELEVLRRKLIDIATSPEHFSEIGVIAKAEIEAKNGDGSNVLKTLSQAGKWSLDIAKKIGISVATTAIKTSLGV